MQNGNLFNLDQLSQALVEVSSSGDLNITFYRLKSYVSTLFSYDDCVVLTRESLQYYRTLASSNSELCGLHWQVDNLKALRLDKFEHFFSDPNTELKITLQGKSRELGERNILMFCLSQGCNDSLIIFTGLEKKPSVLFSQSESFIILLQQLYFKADQLAKAHIQTSNLLSLIANMTEQADLFKELASEWFWRMDCEHQFISVDDLAGPDDLYKQCFIGKTPLLLRSDNEKSHLRKWAQFQHLLSQHDDFFEFEFELNVERHLWVSLSGKAQFTEQGYFNGYMGIAKDITYAKEREIAYKQAKEKAENANSAKSQFLAVMSHEIRTPMNAILGMVELINGTSLTSQQKEWLSYAQSSANLLLGLISDVLDFSKIEAGTLTLDNSHVQFRALIQNIAAQFESHTEAGKLVFEQTIEDNVPDEIKGDSTRLGQILFNLLGNAFKFTSYGRITLSVRCEKGSIIISIADTGIGIAEQDLARLFKPFNQVSDSVKRKQQGVGLGLSITKKLIELMKGTITCSSLLGVGTTFTVILPYQAVQTKKIAPEVPHPDRSLSILVVEDNKPNQVLIEALLLKLNHTVTLAETGSEALNVIKANKFDLVLMDMMMPVMDGLTATKYIREEMSLTVPIFALTANAGQTDKINCLNAGMNKVLTKPIRFVELRSAIDSLYNKDIT